MTKILILEYIMVVAVLIAVGIGLRGLVHDHIAILKPDILVTSIDKEFRGTNLQDIIRTLGKAGPGDEVFVYLNSPGGSVLLGGDVSIALHNTLAGKTLGHIDSWCASMCAVVATQLDELTMTDDAQILFHMPYQPVFWLKIKYKMLLDIAYQTLSTPNQWKDIRNIDNAVQTHMLLINFVNTYIDLHIQGLLTMEELEEIIDEQDVIIEGKEFMKRLGK